MTSLEIDIAFDKIWDFWLNKENGEHAAKKALAVLIKTGIKYDDIYKACRVYSLDHIGDEFTFKLSNFLMRDEWKDVLEGSDLNRLEQQRLLAIEIIEQWNSLCRSHWSKVLNIEDRIPLAKKALSNKFFNDNWRTALNLCADIFRREFREIDNRSKININFKWFTTVTADKHTVLRIMEGDFGKAYTEKESVNKYEQVRVITDEERKATMVLFNEVFGIKTKPPTLAEFD